MSRRKQDVIVAEPVAVSESTTVLNVIERASRDATVDIEKMERLFEMHERALLRDAKAAYAADLAQMQPKLPIIGERGAAAVNGTLRYKFALWEDIVGDITPVISAHGFSLSFRTRSDASSVTITGVLTHRSGHSEQTELTLPIDTSGNKNAVQAIGSSTSYGKRYTASALLNLRTGEEDDDGQAAGAGETISDKQAADLAALAEDVGADVDKFCAYLRIPSLDRLEASQYTRAVKALEAKRRGA